MPNQNGSDSRSDLADVVRRVGAIEEEAKRSTAEIESDKKRIHDNESRLSELERRSTAPFGRRVLHWMLVILIPIFITGMGGYVVRKAAFPEVLLDVMVVKTQSLTAESSIQMGLGSDIELETQLEIQISILNVGSVPAERRDNRLIIEFDKNIDDVYMADFGRLHGQESGDQEYMQELKSCRGRRWCKTNWQTVDPKGQVTLSFAFRDETVRMTKLPYIAHGGRIPERWTCCELHSSLQSRCDEAKSSSWVPSVTRMLQGKSLKCPGV